MSINGSMATTYIAMAIEAFWDGMQMPAVNRTDGAVY